MTLFAHYGGIDEIGVFLVPIVLAIVIVRWLEKRGKARRDAASPEQDPSVEDEDQVST